MRAFGPGSLSSFLKTGLDVAYALLWALAAALAVAVAAAVLSLPFGGGQTRGAMGELSSFARRGPQTAAAAAGAAVYLAALIVVADRLRRVFGTMTAGDPFHPDNVGRMRTIGVALIGVEAAAYGLRFAVAPLFPGSPRPGFDLNATGPLAILVVFVLAEVFREGARLRAEAELTV